MMGDLINFGDHSSGGRIWDLPDDMLHALATELQKKGMSTPTVELASSNLIGLAEALVGITILRQKLQKQAEHMNQFSSLVADAIRDAGGVITAHPGRPYLALSIVPHNEVGEGEDRVAQEIHFVWVPQDNETMLYVGDIIKFDEGDEAMVVGVETTDISNSYLLRKVEPDGLGTPLAYSKDYLFSSINSGDIEIVARTPIVEAAYQNTKEAKEEVEQESGGDTNVEDQGEDNS